MCRYRVSESGLSAGMSRDYTGGQSITRDVPWSTLRRDDDEKFESTPTLGPCLSDVMLS